MMKVGFGFREIQGEDPKNKENLLEYEWKTGW